MTPQLPPSPGNGGTLQQTPPDQLNADLAVVAMVREVVRSLGRPSIVTKKFVVFKGIWSALNNDPPMFNDAGFSIRRGHLTGYDCSLRLRVYDEVEKGSVNINGAFFNNLWSFAMKPKVTIAGIPANLGFEKEEEPGFFSRAWGRLTGKSSQDNGGRQQ